MMTDWIQTYTGRKFPITLDVGKIIPHIYLSDICHHLSHINRFNGATYTPINVAQHSLAVAAIVPNEFRREALLHDAAEAYIGDISRPLKGALNVDEIESAIWEAICNVFNLRLDLHPLVKRADNSILFYEKKRFMTQCDWGWDESRELPEEQFEHYYSMSAFESRRALFKEVASCM